MKKNKLNLLTVLAVLIFCIYSMNSFADSTNTCPSLYYIVPNVNYSEAIDYAGDVDVVSITVPSSGMLTIFTTGTTDTYGDLKNSNCVTIASNHDANGTRNFSISANVTAGKYYISIRHYSPLGTGAYGISSKFVAATATTSSVDVVGNTCATATNMLNNGTINSSIDLARDVDYFKIVTLSDSILTLGTTGLTDTYGDLKDSNCNTIASNDDQTTVNRNFSINKTILAGTYFIAVRHYSATGKGAYTISNKVAPIITKTLAELATSNTLDASVLDHILIANYTDPLTLPQTKITGGNCTSTYDTGVPDLATCSTSFDACASMWHGPFGTSGCLPGTTTRCSNIIACNAYAPIQAWKSVMNCEWYVNAPVSSSMRFQVGALQTTYNAFIASLVNTVKAKIQSAITSALFDGAVSAAAAAFPSAGTAAVPTFVTVFGYAINIRHLS